MNRKFWASAAVGAFLLLALPAHAGSSAKPVTLGETVTITGSRSGFVPVTVPKDTALGNPFVTKHRSAVTVTGGGEVAGFALVQDGLKGPILVGGRSEAYAPYVKRHGIVINSLRPNPQDGVTFAVPAGVYRLYLVTGGEPTTVTLRFLGGSGTSRLSPTTNVMSVVQKSDLTAPAPGPVGGVHSGGGAVTLTTPILQFSLNRLDTSAHTESVQRYCYYFGKPAGPQPYGPACAAPAQDTPVVFDPLGSVFLVSAEGVGPQSFYGWNASLTTSRSEPVRATVASGVSYTTAGVVTYGDYSQFWLSLDAAPAPHPRAVPPQPAVPAAPVREPAQQVAAAPAASPAQQVPLLPSTGPGVSALVAPVLLVAAAATRSSGRCLR